MYHVTFIPTPKFYGERCNLDQECQLGDYNLQCIKNEIRICKCKRGYVWDLERKKCLPTLEDDMYSGRFDPVRDLIIPGLIVMTIGAMVYLGFKLFCNCGKLWRRRRHQEMARELEDLSTAPHPQAWIASYRVFSPYHNANRPSSTLSPSSFPLHSTPCMGLFVPSQSLNQNPPSYEEALKHKVILSSYHNVGPPVVPAPLYTVPAPDVHRQYQSLTPQNSSSSSSIVLGPNVPPPSVLKTSAASTPRAYPMLHNNNYGILPISSDWTTQFQYSGTTAVPQAWNNHNSSPSTIRAQEPNQGHSDSAEMPLDPRSRTPSMEMWVPSQRQQQQSRPISHRPGHPQKIYHGSDSFRNI